MCLDVGENNHGGKPLIMYSCHGLGGNQVKYLISDFYDLFSCNFTILKLFICFRENYSFSICNLSFFYYFFERVNSYIYCSRKMSYCSSCCVPLLTFYVQHSDSNF